MTRWNEVETSERAIVFLFVCDVLWIDVSVGRDFDGWMGLQWWCEVD